MTARVDLIAYARGVRRLTAGSRYDLVFATSSRLMTACLGVVVARQTRSPLFLDIRDVFPEGIRDVISEGHVPYFEERFSGRRFTVVPNGIDDAFLEVDWGVDAITPRASGGPLSLMRLLP